jgi:hypothetical protein
MAILIIFAGISKIQKKASLDICHSSVPRMAGNHWGSSGISWINSVMYSVRGVALVSTCRNTLSAPGLIYSRSHRWVYCDSVITCAPRKKLQGIYFIPETAGIGNSDFETSICF